MAANGAVALQQMQNRMLTQMNMDHRQEASRNQEAHRSDITSAGNQLARRHGDSSTFTDVKGHDATRGQYQNSGVVASRGQEGSQSGQHVTGQNLDKSSREASGFRTGAGVQDQLSMGIGVRSGRSGGAGYSGGAANSRDAKRIGDAMRQGGAEPQQIDQALKNYQGSKGGGSPLLGGLFSANLGYGGMRNYTAEHSRDRTVDTVHGGHEAARTERSFADRGAHTTQMGTGDQSAQSSRHGRDAAMSNVDEVSSVQDVSDRREYGVGSRSSRSESDSFSTHKDLMADPYLFEKVAARNGMTAMRFANQSENRILEMVQAYAGEKGAVQQASAMPQKTFAGESLPTTRRGLERQSASDRADIPKDLQGVHRQKVAQTGYTGTTPLAVDTSAPSIVSEARSEVQGQLDPQHKGSIPARAAALDENVHAWASPDKAMGEGRANPAQVTEGAMLRDGKDTVKKVWDKVKGGDGTADGEKLNDNMKRETAASVSINNGSK